MAKTVRKTPKKDWKPAFLRELARTGNVSLSADKAKISRPAAYAARESDPGFAAAWKDAVETSVEYLEGEARRRAYEGTQRPVYQGGKLVGKVREYSDTLLIFLLKAHRPEKYRDRQQVEHTGGLTQTVIYLPAKDAAPA